MLIGYVFTTKNQPWFAYSTFSGFSAVFCFVCKLLFPNWKRKKMRYRHALYLQPILIHSIHTVLITNFLSCMAIHLILMAVSCLKLNCQLKSQPPKPVNCTCSSSDFILYSGSNWLVNSMLTWLFRHAGYSDGQWNQSKIVIPVWVTSSNGHGEISIHFQ